MDFKAGWITVAALLCVGCAGMQRSADADGAARHAWLSKLEIAELINNWAFYRDQGRWDSLLETFHEDGTISLSWYDGPYQEFVSGSRRLAEAHQDTLIKHQMGTPSIAVNGERALSEVNVTIMVRAVTPTASFEQTSYARFLDRVERRNGRWRLVRRTAIYERDRVDPVDRRAVPAALFENLEQYPQQVMFLASAMRTRGATLSKTAVLDKSIELERLYSESKLWLSNDDTRP